MCSKLSISRQELRLFEAPQELLLLFSYLSVSRFSIRFSIWYKKHLVNSMAMGISHVKIYDMIW